MGSESGIRATSDWKVAMRLHLITPLVALLAAGSDAPDVPRPGAPPAPTNVMIQLTEWKVSVDPAALRPGVTRFIVHNGGAVPHGVEVEGQGIERSIPLIQPGATDTLTVTLKTGRYEVYCPIGAGSHKKLGMDTHFSVGPTRTTGPAADAPYRVQAIHVVGGGPVIQILPGPFPFPDSAAPILRQFGDEREGLESQVKDGPYSDNVARISGTFSFDAVDLGATKDSVAGTAEFNTKDGARWRLLIDRVQTKDVAHHPRFGGVILGLYYHGSTGVHTPLVPTINSAVALWAFAHLYRNDTLVTDRAAVHVMLLSRTRRMSDFALQCWDCSKNVVDELQLQVLPGAGEAMFDAPGGFLFINWERSVGTKRKP